MLRRYDMPPVKTAARLPCHGVLPLACAAYPALAGRTARCHPANHSQCQAGHCAARARNAAGHAGRVRCRPAGGPPGPAVRLVRGLGCAEGGGA